MKRNALGTSLVAGLTATLALAIAALACADDSRLSDYFGFQPLEVYKLDSRISNLCVGDLDGDKTNDVIVSNNGRSRIDALLSTKDVAATSIPRFLKSDVNEIDSERRMRLVSIPVNKEVVSLVVGDFNGDGQNDIAFYGNPSELIVLYNKGKGRFDAAESKRINCGQAIESQTALTAADLNGDGRMDLALLSAEEMVLVLQDSQGKLGDPSRLPHSSDSPQMLRAADLDGDGRQDLIILDGGKEDPIRVRFATKSGDLGPEQRFRVEDPRAIALAAIDQRPGVELLTIENQSGRVKVLTLDEAKGDDGAQRGRFIVFPLPPGNARGRSLAVGDLDGDGRSDVVVTDPSNAQFFVHRQVGAAGLSSGQTFPGLIGGKTVKLADLDGDQKAEVYVLSEQEKQVGRSTFADGRLTFPAPLPLSGEPVALDVADLDGDGLPEVVYVARSRADGRDEFTLKAVRREKSGTFVPYRWGPDDSVTLKGIPGTPAAIEVLDVNRDGQPDILVFNGYGPPTLLLARRGEPPAPAGGNLGPLAGVTHAGLSQSELDGPALIVAQNSFARRLLLDKNGRWEVQDQYNTGRSSAQVLGATAFDVDGDGHKEIALLDRTSKSLLFLELKDGVYRPAGSLSVGAIDFQGMSVADFDGDGHDDLLIAGTDRFGIVTTGRKGQQLRQIASYESNRTEARLGDLIVADLNGDKRPDVVLTDVAENFIEIATDSGAPELNRALSFRVFERKSFRGGLDSAEPRDLNVGDVDGDGLADLVLMVHDRILIYRQDPGPPPKKDDK